MRRHLLTLIILTGLASAGFIARATAASSQCDVDGSAFGSSRTLQIDARAGPIFGALTRQAREPSFLNPKEVVLTFDDGPMPWITKSILDTLDSFCAKATFFSVGKMALAYPETVKQVLARGHTLGTHTYSHPFNMPRMKPEAAVTEIERGVAAVTMAAGAPIAPFFRFTGLSDSNRLMGHLQTRGIAAFTVDAVSNDSYINDPAKLADRTMTEIANNKGGIVLFHDIKASTAKALPVILNRLKAQGYKVVHITAKSAVEPLAAEMQVVAPKLARAANGEPGGKTLLPFYGALGPSIAKTPEAAETANVTALAPQPRNRDAQSPAAPKLAGNSIKPSHVAMPRTTARTIPANATGSADTAAWLKNSIVETSGPPVLIGADAGSIGWATQVRPQSDAKPIKPAR